MSRLDKSFVSIFAASFITFGPNVIAQDNSTAPDTVSSNPPAGYKLVWSDEFSNDGLPDPTKWSYDTHRNEDGWYNNEDQYYAEARLKNSRVENGTLIIEAHKENLNLEGFQDWGGQSYSSARLITQGKAEWTYGFYEIRAQMPCGVGTWPAIWTLYADPNNRWPDGGEIDIMEHVGFEPDIVHQTIHTKAFNHSDGTDKSGKTTLPTVCDAMHKYQLTWTEDRLIFGIDDIVRFIFEREDGDDRWPFFTPQFLLLNIAVGGDWGGQKGVDDDAFPAKMLVDYVRVYQTDGTTENPNGLPRNTPGLPAALKEIDDILPGGLLNDPTRTNWDAYGGTTDTRDVTGPSIPGIQSAKRFTMDAKGNVHDGGINIPLLAPIQTGEPITVGFFARTLTANTSDGRGKLGIRFQQNRPPYPGFGETTLDIDKDWGWYEATSVADQTISEDGIVALQFGLAEQTIEIGQTFVVVGADTIID